MARNLGSSIQSTVTQATCSPAIFVDLTWPSGSVRVWSGIGPFTFGGNTFTGVGNLGGVSPIPESSDGRADGITVTLSGIPTEILAAVLGDHYQGRSGKVYIGFLNDAGALISDPPYLAFSGKMDVASIREEGETSTVSVTIENRMIILQQASNRRFTHEDQKIDYPTDLFFEYVAAINQDRPINWGQAGASVLSRDIGSSRMVY